MRVFPWVPSNPATSRHLSLEMNYRTLPRWIPSPSPICDHGRLSRTPLTGGSRIREHGKGNRGVKDLSLPWLLSGKRTNTYDDSARHIGEIR